VLNPKDAKKMFAKKVTERLVNRGSVMQGWHNIQEKREALVNTQDVNISTFTGTPIVVATSLIYAPPSPSTQHHRETKRPIRS
jgi:hypothetical protein